MKSSLSVLIPCYNSSCVELVTTLAAQLQRYKAVHSDFCYEIVVADDGSTNLDAVAICQGIKAEGYRYIRREENVGRAAIRNFLVQQAQYPWLLFMDCDMEIEHDDFIVRYLEAEGEVVVGGLKTSCRCRGLEHQLGYLVEKQAEGSHTASLRQMREHRDFRTGCFLMARHIALQCPFDETIKTYGYEDSLMGKMLCAHNIPIHHIENPAAMLKYDDNATFIKKTEEAMRTLKSLETQMRGYSTLIDYADHIKQLHMTALARILYKVWGGCIRNTLIGSRPRVFLLQVYKLLYFISLGYRV